MTPELRVAAAIGVARRFAPAFTVVPKADSKLHRVLGWAAGLIGNKAYMASTWTTLGFTVGEPLQGAGPNTWETVLHEGRHAADAARLTRAGFYLAYLLPQALAPLSVILAGVLGAPWLLLGALLALPLPAPLRLLLELRAFKVSIAVRHWAGRDVPDSELDRIAGKLAGPPYYWAWPLRAWLWGYLDRWRTQLKQGDPPYCTLDPYLQACCDLAHRVRG